MTTTPRTLEGETMDPRVMAIPRVRLVCGHDWMRPGRCYEIGAYWDANPWPDEGALIYRRCFVIRIQIDRYWWN